MLTLTEVKNAKYFNVITLKGKQWKVKIDIIIKNDENEKINYKTMKKEKIPVLSICGYVYYRNGNRGRFGFYSCGQIYDTLKDLIKNNQLDINEKQKEKLKELISIWKRYHLNDLKAGTYNQEKIINEYFKNKEYDYDKACEILKEKELYIDNGYRYGNGWLCEKLPDDLIERLENICKEFLKK